MVVEEDNKDEFYNPFHEAMLCDQATRKGFKEVGSSTRIQCLEYGLMSWTSQYWKLVLRIIFDRKLLKEERNVLFVKIKIK